MAPTCPPLPTPMMLYIPAEHSLGGSGGKTHGVHKPHVFLQSPWT